MLELKSLVLSHFKKLTRPIIQKLKKILFDQVQFYYSQEGEDIILPYICPQEVGLYVDVGAYDPVIFSNTYLFYKRGWSGLVIDPRPGTIKRFGRIRPRDKAIEMGISESKGELVYYQFKEENVNTFDEQTMIRNRQRGYHFINKKTIKVDTLTNILDSHLNLKGKSIDLLSLDVEGYEFHILKALDWNKYAPKVICVEISKSNPVKSENTWLDLEEIARTEVYQYLKQKQYRPIAKTIHSVYFIRRNDISH